MRSKISQLPQELRDELERLRVEKGWTHRELLAYLKSFGADVSIGGVRRYVHDLERRMERYQQAHAVASAWIARFAREPEGNVGRLLIEMLRMVAFRQLADFGADSAEAAAKPAEIGVLARAIRDIETASKALTEREAAVREKLKARIDRKADAMKRDGSESPGDVATLDKAKELVRGLL